MRHISKWRHDSRQLVTTLTIMESHDDCTAVEIVVPTGKVALTAELLGTCLDLLEIEAIVWHK